MLFHSPEFLFTFLPAALILHRFTVGLGPEGRYGNLARVCLLLLTLVFYGWREPWWLIPFALSVAFDFLWASLLVRHPSRGRLLCGLSVVQNLCLLGFFKYWDPIVGRLAHWVPWTEGYFSPHGLVLPAGISFYTFESLSFVIDVYRREIKPPKNPLDFFGFMAMFPRFVAGPIVRYKDMVPQFGSYRGMRIESGLFLFVYGLFLKLCLADSFAVFTPYAYGFKTSLDWVSGWIGVVAYTMQIYFDFSGYSLMAIGLGRCLGFEFPKNFERPYLATTLQDFWRRWHISLSTWLRDYLYISLGGNRRGKLRGYLNIFLTMVIGGIWHGAGLNFVFWGAWHGAALCAERALGWNAGGKPSFLGQGRTLLLVMVGWVFFKAGSPTEAARVFKAIFFLDEGMGRFNADALVANPVSLVFCAFGLVHCFVFEEKIASLSSMEPRPLGFREELVGVAMLTLSLVFGLSQFIVPFLYFQF